MTNEDSSRRDPLGTLGLPPVYVIRIMACPFMLSVPNVRSTWRSLDTAFVFPLCSRLPGLLWKLREIKLLWKLREIINRKHLQQCLIHSKNWQKAITQQHLIATKYKLCYLLSLFYIWKSQEAYVILWIVLSYIWISLCPIRLVASFFYDVNNNVNKVILNHSPTRFLYLPSLATFALQL